MYTTNAIQGLNAQLRKVTMKRGSFPKHEGEIHLLKDIMMPGVNGVEVAERVLRMRPGIRIF